jgi:hypothetical protein
VFTIGYVQHAWLRCHEITLVSLRVEDLVECARVAAVECGGRSWHFFWADGGNTVARRWDDKPVLKLDVGLDESLAQAVRSGADASERRWSEEVRYQLRKAYGLDQTPAEASADAVSA